MSDCPCRGYRDAMGALRLSGKNYAALRKEVTALSDRAEALTAELTSLLGEQEGLAALLARFDVETVDELIDAVVPKSWEGLLTILADIYPASVFGGTSADWQDETSDLGPRLVTLTRHLDAERRRAELAELRAEVLTASLLAAAGKRATTDEPLPPIVFRVTCDPLDDLAGGLFVPADAVMLSIDKTAPGDGWRR